MARPTFFWTEEAERLLLELRDDEAMLWPDIAAEIGASEYACRVHYERVKPSFRADACRAAGSFRAPNAAVIDRDKREEARRSREHIELSRGICTSSFFGDPPPGFSALDRRRARA